MSAQLTATNRKPIRVALVGCGAVVQRSHIPALNSNLNYSIEVLVDRNPQQLESVQKQINAPVVTSNVHDVLDDFDLAVVATPSATHFALGAELLGQSKHVLMEKPLATSSQDAISLVAAANKSSRLLCVSLVRRYLPHFRLFKQLISADIIGRVNSFSITEGSVFNWPVQSADFYSKSASGGGVLVDHGAHLLDACLWWFGDYSNVRYTDDARGGVEADCELQITMKSGAKGQIIMSRLRDLPGLVVADGEKASIEMNLATGAISISPRGDHALSLAGAVKAPTLSGQMSTVDLFREQYEQIYAYLKDPSLAADLVTGEKCLSSIKLIEECYSVRSSDNFKVWS